MGQNGILLCFVEAMDFVNEQNGRGTGVFEAVGGRGEHATHVGHVGFGDAGLPTEGLDEARKFVGQG